MKKIVLWGLLAFLIGFGLTAPDVYEPLQVMWYWNDHKPYDSYDGAVEYLGVIPADSYGGTFSGLAYRGWKDEDGLHHYRFVNVGEERIYVHSSFFQRHLGLRHLVLGPGYAEEFRVHPPGPTAVADMYTIIVSGGETSWLFWVLQESIDDAYFVVPAGNFR